MDTAGSKKQEEEAYMSDFVNNQQETWNASHKPSVHETLIVSLRHYFPTPIWPFSLCCFYPRTGFSSLLRVLLTGPSISIANCEIWHAKTWEVFIVSARDIEQKSEQGIKEIFEFSSSLSRLRMTPGVIDGKNERGERSVVDKKGEGIWTAQQVDSCLLLFLIL